MTENFPTQKADFFSVFLQQKLSTSLQNSLTYMTRTFLLKYGSTGPTNKNLAPAISHGLDFLINAAFLALTDANFSEFFYFLQRKSVRGESKKSRLRVGLKFKLLLLRVIGGYLLPKLKLWAGKEVERGRYSMDLGQQRRERGRIRRLKGLKRVIKVLLVGIDLVNYGFNIK